MLPLLMLGYYVIHLIPLLQSYDENGIRTTPELYFIPNNLTYSPEMRCPLFGSSHKVNLGKNLYTVKPFARVSATPYEVTQHLPAFLKDFTPPACFRVVAIMAGFNEADVLLSSISNLIYQDIDVHFIDNWSTDSTATTLRQLQHLYPGRITSEKFPEVDSKLYNWASLLERKAAVAMTLRADWIIHIDPDELRESPWGTDVSLRRALYIADQLEYNLVNFGNVLVFHPLKNTSFSPKDSLRTSFLHYSTNKFSGDAKQSKAWKTYYSSCDSKHITLDNKPITFDLAQYGGHIFKYGNAKGSFFPGHILFPYTFVLRHYPIRSQEHGMRKVFTERTSRWNESERDKLDWHKQYDALQKGHNFLGDDKELFRAYDNGDLPSGMFSSFLPCRKESKSTKKH